MNLTIKTACIGLLSALCLSGCADLNEEKREAQREHFKAMLDASAPPKRVVATVNGRPISASALEELARLRVGATTRELLDELIDAELRYQEGLEAGYGDDAAMRELHARLMVQQMLKERALDEVGEEDIDPERVEMFYKKREGWYYAPVTRVVDHILIMPSSGKWNLRKEADTIPREVYAKANAIAQKLRKRLGDAKASEYDRDTIQKLAEELAESAPEELEVKAEFDLKTPRRSVGLPGTRGYKPGMVEPFTEGVFGTPLGEISSPVRTIFGSHVVFVRFERPERRRPLSEFEDSFRGILVGRDRRRLGEQIITAASRDAEIKVNYDPLSQLNRAPGGGGGDAPQ